MTEDQVQKEIRRMANCERLAARNLGMSEREWAEMRIAQLKVEQKADAGKGAQ